MGIGDHNAGRSPCDGLASHPGGRSNIPSRFMLQKPELSAGLMPPGSYADFTLYLLSLHAALHFLSNATRVFATLVIIDLVFMLYIGPITMIQLLGLKPFLSCDEMYIVDML